MKTIVLFCELARDVGDFVDSLVDSRRELALKLGGESFHLLDLHVDHLLVDCHLVGRKVTAVSKQPEV